MNNKTILITGGTGSWGQALVKKLLTKEPKEIRIFSRNEALQVEMKQAFQNHPLLTFIIGDIRDKYEIIQACQQVDVIYHLAALKHVPICEQQPDCAYKTNVLGTQHVIQAAIQNKVEKVIYVSTDKASHPSSTYGMTKALGEKLIIHANLRESSTQFVCVRSGNVLGSTGSVVPIFKQRIEQGLDVCLTDNRMTRFFLTISDAIQLLLKATEDSRGGEIYVTKMPACRIKDLAEVLIENFTTSAIGTKEIGMRPGERLNEILISEFESYLAINLDDDYYVILPPFPIEGLQAFYASFAPVDLKSYDSEHALMNQHEIRDMLHKGGLMA
ncbi:SDR family NAD(P)-dependent oxidoreductase [Paenibacillus sp. SYP-B3998]|uniref:SDR family NAD(P)-dependent oxidoreductase n=1 Tax=Paenibacillus sp. SYP-B3998 TaxID=2678564 RepID=A0A6G3ZYV8_9BACL|nr:SDR family NAD(P)-dependent oxidoreductase [Paenibacillus sp. SYP-B3998]NEW06761.1 SDR family NAD(P)-dependent oxidoreductase [Paenibacillus sp. SYP-B3998]